MRHLTRRTIFLCNTSPSSSSSSPYILLFHTSNNVASKWYRREGTSHSFSSSSSSHSPSSSWRHHHDEESRNVKVSVWWDFENCHVPSGVNVLRVAQRITSALRTNGIKGPITITAFGDFLQLSRANQEALSMSGVSLNHVPRGGKNSADRSLLVDLMCWVSQNPPPAHLFLISGDRDFANILHRLRMNNYNILLACTEPASGILCSATSIMWPWNPLVKGENSSGKHFSQPPDGPYGSWYGYYKGPLDDPFLDMEQPTCSLPESSDPPTDFKPRSLPKALTTRICQILNLYPKGVPISELRIELGRSNTAIDKDFFGYKNFSSLLKSLPTILSLESAGDGNFIVHAVQPKIAEPIVSSSKLVAPCLQNNVGKDSINANTKLNGRNNDVTKISVQSPSPLCSPRKEEPPPPSPNTDVVELPGDSSSSSDSPPKEEPSHPGHEKIHDHLAENQPTPSDDDHLAENQPTPSEDGSGSETGFFRRIWRTWFIGESSASSQDSNSSSTTDSIGEKKAKEKVVDSKSHGPVSCILESSMSVTNDSVDEGKTKVTSEDNGDKSSMGFFDRIMNWYRPRETERELTNTSEQFGNKVNMINNETEDNKLFSKETFWDELETFLRTPKGSTLISQSKNREQVVQGLQKQGPPVLHVLQSGELLRLVDLLISDKEWVEEKPFQTTPFKLNLPAQKCPSPSKYQGSKGLSSIFSATSSQADSKIPQNHKTGNGNNTRTGACSVENTKKLSDKSKVNSPGSNLSHSARKGDDQDNLWKELGPISEKGSSRNDLKSGFNGKTTNEKREVLNFDDASFSDDSESDGESAIKLKSERKGASKNSDEDSSLLRILDSWYTKDEKAPQGHPLNANKGVDNSKNDMKISSVVGADPRTGRTANPRKNYSFVSDADGDGDGDDRGKMIDTILGSLKKSSEPRVHS